MLHKFILKLASKLPMSGSMRGRLVKLGGVKIQNIDHISVGDGAILDTLNPEVSYSTNG